MEIPLGIGTFVSPKANIRVMSPEVSEPASDATRESSPQAEQWWSVRLSHEIVLPSLCPGCLAPGVRPLPVAACPGHALENTPSPTAHYCELCADGLSAQDTARLAWSLALLLVALSAVTAVTLALGSLSLPLQFGAVLTVGGGLTLVLWLLDQRALPPLLVDGRGTPPRLLCRRRDYLRLLGESPSAARAAPPRGLRARALLPILAACAFWGILHLWGSAQVVVLLGSQESAVLTIDDRLRLRFAGSREERPGQGPSVRTLGGRRHVGLHAASGEELISEFVTFWPRKTYLVGLPPEGYCFFVETQEYGEVGSAHYLQPLRPQGAVWEVPVTIDRWFAAPEPRPDLETTGGTRRALRLLPCESPSR